MEDKIFKLSEKVVVIFLTVFTLLFSLTNLFFTVHTDNLVGEVSYVFGLIPINIIAVTAGLFLLYIAIRKDFFGIKERTLLILFLIISFLVGMTWIFINDIELREYDDAYNVFHAALNISNGNYEPLGFKTYLSVYPNNIGIMTYFLIHIKLFGEYYSLYSIRIVNLVFVLVGYISIYRISDRLFQNRTVNCVTVLLMFLSMQFVFYSFFVYGNCISYACSLMSVWMLVSYLQDRKESQWILMVITITLSIAIKMNSLIILIAEVIFLLLDFFRNRKPVVIAMIVLILLSSFIGTTGLENYWANRAEIDYDDTKLPTICWIAYGMNYGYNNPGSYTNELEVYHVENGQVAEFTSIKAKEFIHESLNEFKNNPVKALGFYMRKFMVSWANPQYDAFGQYSESLTSKLSCSVIGGTLNSIFEIIWDATLTLVSIGLVCYLLIKKEKSINELIPAVVIIGGFLFHSFWEVKSIYTYQYYLFILPYAAYGISELSILNKKGKKNEVGN